MTNFIGWSDTTSFGGGVTVDSLVFAQFGVTDGVPRVSAFVTIREGFVCTVQVEGKDIASQHTGCNTISSLSELTSLFSFLASCKLCCGNSDEKFLPLVTARKGKFLDSSGKFLNCL